MPSAAAKFALKRRFGTKASRPMSARKASLRAVFPAIRRVGYFLRGVHIFLRATVLRGISFLPFTSGRLAAKIFGKSMTFGELIAEKGHLWGASLWSIKMDFRFYSSY
jgi:hypothetical protein